MLNNIFQKLVEQWLDGMGWSFCRCTIAPFSATIRVHHRQSSLSQRLKDRNHGQTLAMIPGLRGHAHRGFRVNGPRMRR